MSLHDILQTPRYIQGDDPAPQIQTRKLAFIEPVIGCFRAYLLKQEDYTKTYHYKCY